MNINGKDVYVDVVRSRRKTLVISIVDSSHILVKAPISTKDIEIYRFLDDKKDWLIKNISFMQKIDSEKVELSDDRLSLMKREAKKILPEKCDYYAKILGVSYNRITIRHQRTVWGSCSGKGNLNFNVLLMAMPDDVQNYVVIHELCHLKEMNHSPKFWELVSTVMPDYMVKRRYLKTEGKKYF